MKERSVRKTDAKPTIRQVYAIARALLHESGEAWPRTREEASELIDRLRVRDESGVLPRRRPKRSHSIAA